MPINLESLPEHCRRARKGAEFRVQTIDSGVVQVRVYDRICPDDVVMHLMRRELVRLVGREDPGVEISKDVIDFLVVEGLLT